MPKTNNNIIDQRNKTKHGMYGELPKVTIGKFSISQKTNKEDETGLFIMINSGDDEGEGMGIDGKFLEPLIQDFYNKNF